MESILNDLPPDWKIAAVGEILKVRNGFAFKSSDYQEEGVPIIRQSDLSDGLIDISKSKRVTLKFLTELPDYIVRDGDLLIGMSGSLGKIARYNEHVPVLQNQRTGLLMLREGIDSRFAKLVLRFVEPQILSEGKGVAVQNVSSKDIESCRFPLPPEKDRVMLVDEIEKQFSRLDEAVAALKRIKANLKRYKASMLKAAVEGKLTEEWRKQNLDIEPAEKLLKRILTERKKKWESEHHGKKYKEPSAPDTSNLPELPKGWVWAKSDQLFCFVTSGSRGWASYYSNSGPLFLRMGNLDHDTINLDLSDIQRVQPPEGTEGTRTRVMAGDILISITADVGMVGLFPDGFEEAYINQHVALARAGSSTNKTYLAWFLACKDGQDQLRQLQRGATKVGLGLEDIRAVSVPLPPLKEQTSIIEEIDRIFSVADEIEAVIESNLKRAERLQQAILKKAFSGRLVERYGS